MLCAGRLCPVIAARFPLEQAADALRMLARRQNYGRVLILPTAEAGTR